MENPRVGEIRRAVQKLEAAIRQWIDGIVAVMNYENVTVIGGSSDKNAPVTRIQQQQESTSSRCSSTLSSPWSARSFAAPLR